MIDQKLGIEVTDDCRGLESEKGDAMMQKLSRQHLLFQEQRVLQAMATRAVYRSAVSCRVTDESQAT